MNISAMGHFNLFLCTVLSLWGIEITRGQETLLSPNGRISITASLSADGSPKYRVGLKSENGTASQVIDGSSIGLITSFRNQEEATVQQDFTRALKLVGSERRRVEDDYELKVGKRLLNHAVANEMSLLFQAESGRQMRVDFRAYDEGVAFRYVLLEDKDPKVSRVYHTVEKELTEFNLGTQGKHFGQPYDRATTYSPGYETPYLVSGLPIGTATDPKLGIGWGFPSLFELPAAWVLLHEVGPYGKYHAMHLDANPEGGVYRVVPPPANEAAGNGAVTASNPLPWTLPWRMIAVSGDLAGIVESNLVFHLAEPSRVPDTGWIKPGTASWSWLSDHDSSRNEATLKKFIDFSAEMGWRYSLVDANWNTISDTVIENLVGYGRERGVGLFFWYNSGGANNWVQEEPRNLMSERSVRRAEFAKLKRLGVKGVKIDFFQSDKQILMEQYIGILEDAAEFEIMVNFHGCTMPRGWERTFPNLMSMEAVRGAETYTFGGPAYGKLAPGQNTVLPFTRNVIGSMDFTPVDFSIFKAGRTTTNTHEAALAVVFESGILHLSDSVEAYKSLPENYQNYLRNVPAVWDETRLVAGYPGKLAVLARRSGHTWYIAGINGEDTAKSVRLKLPFQPKGGGMMLYDTTNPKEFASKEIELGQPNEIEVTFQPFGGVVLIVEAR
ncbi:MAG: glycoside hydrolase family 97 catalytic domain-containing protein [Luteolibacter sp.]